MNVNKHGFVVENSKGFRKVKPKKKRNRTYITKDERLSYLKKRLGIKK